MDGMNIQEATAVELTEAERAVLESVVRSPKVERRIAERAQIVLLAARGLATRAIHRELGCTIGTASKWRVRFSAHPPPGASSTPPAGRRAGVTPDAPRQLPANHHRTCPPWLRRLPAAH